MPVNPVEAAVSAAPVGLGPDGPRPDGPTVVVTMCSAGRLDHVRNQQRLLGRWAPAVERVIVWLDETPPPAFDGGVVVSVPPGRHGLRLAAGRNAGAEAALALRARLLIFLDADCVPGPELVASYERAAGVHGGGILCGAVTYLAEGFELAAGSSPSREREALRDATNPHPARPAPAPGVTHLAESDAYALFWSLSFAVTPLAWSRVGGFDERFEGYGGEDTDFAFRARAAQVPLVWVGGADAYHQHHPTSSPPWQHLDDILRNGRLFADRWGVWPMGGWIEAFERAGAVEWSDARGWARTAADIPAVSAP